MKPIRSLWSDPSRHATLLPVVAQQRREQCVAALHAIRLLKLDGVQPLAADYDGVSAAVIALPDGAEIYRLVMEATFEWPSVRGYAAGVDFDPFLAPRLP